MNTEIMLTIFAIVAALELAGVVIMESIMQESEAAGRAFPGYANTPGLDASKGQD